MNAPIPFANLSDDAVRFIQEFPTTIDPTTAASVPMNITSLLSTEIGSLDLRALKGLIPSFGTSVVYDYATGKITFTEQFFTFYRDELLCFENEQVDALAIAQWVVERVTGSLTVMTIASNLKHISVPRINVAMKFLVKAGHLAVLSTTKNPPYLYYTVSETASTHSFAFPADEEPVLAPV